MQEQFILIKKSKYIKYFKDKGLTIIHRIDGPAVEYANGSKFWCINDKFHREDGPALEYVNGVKKWCVYGVFLTEEEFNTRYKK